MKHLEARAALLRVKNAISEWIAFCNATRLSIVAFMLAAHSRR